MNWRQVERNAGNDRETRGARTDLGDIRHVKLEARRGARSRGDRGRVEQGRVIREGGDHDRAASSCTYLGILDKKSSVGMVFAPNILIAIQRVNQVDNILRKVEITRSSLVSHV